MWSLRTLAIPTLFLCYYGIGQPLRVKNLLNSPSLFELCYLVPDSIRMILGWVPKKLLFRGDRWVDIQIVADETRIHPWSFASTPCENIDVPPKKIYQLFFLLKRQLSPDLKKLLRIIPHNNLLQILAFRLLGQPIGRWRWGLRVSSLDNGWI